MKSRHLSLFLASLAGLSLSLVGVAPAQAAPDTLRAGSFNIKDPDSSSAAPWEQTRAPMVASEIVSQGLDVMGVQELYNPRNRTSFMDALTRASNGAYRMTFSEDDQSGYDNRIVYNARRVRVITAGDYVFGNQLGGDPTRHLVWAAMQNLTNGSQFLFVTTHLCPSSDPVTRRQWKELLTYTAALRDRYNLPVIAVGDYNTTKFERPAKKLLKKMYRAGFGDILGQTFRSYRTRNARVVGAERVNANYGSTNAGPVAPNKNGNSIDWFFVSNQLDVTRYEVVINRTASDHNLITSHIVLP